MSSDEVLVIEDEPNWQHYLKRILERRGYTVKSAATTEEALEAFRAASSKVAVVDISLIKGDAYDRQGRALIEQARIPVVCVSGILPGHEVGQLLMETDAKWFFDKKEIESKEEQFLDAVEMALLDSKETISARWRQIERWIRPGD